MRFNKLLFVFFVPIIISACAQPNEPAVDNNSLQVYNIIETNGYAYDFDVSDELLFVAEDQRGFSIHNFASGSLYCHEDTLFDNTPDPFENVRKIAGYADDDFLLVYDRYGSPASFNIFGIDDLQNPVFLFNMTSNTADVQKVLVNENAESELNIFWTNSNHFNIATYENNWLNDATIDFPNSVAGFDLNSEIIVVAGNQAGIYIVDKASQQILLTYDTISEAVDVKLVDNYAFVALWEEGFLILDLSDPANPVEINQENVGENIYTIDVHDDLMLLSSHTGGVMLFDISDASTPTLLGKLKENDIGYTYKASFEEEYIVASTRKGIVIIEY